MNGNNTDQIAFSHRTAVKGSSVSAPSGISTPMKHNETKADAELCADTPVSDKSIIEQE